MKNLIIKKIIKIISGKFNKHIAHINLIDHLVKDFNIDDLDKVEFILALESEFNNLEVSGKEAEKLQTVRDAINFISAY